MTKDLIGSQVIDHMQWQCTASGDGKPATTAVVFLESARRLLDRATWRRRAQLARRAPSVRVAVLPIIGRMSREANIRVLARALRSLVGSRRVVFHCRGESSAEWAEAISTQLGVCGLVLDVRGAWPEEQLFARGFDGPLGADREALFEYESSLNRLRGILERSGAVLTVSNPLANWITALGKVNEPIAVVPCCVSACAYDPDVRRSARTRLGLSDKLVLSYVGTMNGYQHVADGALRFAANALEIRRDVHLLALTNEPSKLLEAARALGISPTSMTVCCVEQQEVQAYLLAADAGLLLREPSRMNRVSMPVKLGEYLSCGVPVIVSRMDGWVDDLVRDGGAGMAITWFGISDEERKSTVASILSTLSSHGTQLREHAAALCRERFTWSQYTQPVRDAYARSLKHG